MEDFKNVPLVNLDKLQANTGQIDGVPANPRVIKNKEFDDLIISLLVFPQMLFLRPITYAGEDYAVLGGNQRRAALIDISKMKFPRIVKKLESLNQFTEKPEEERNEIAAYWREFLKFNEVPAQDASKLSIEQMQEFVIKDNVPAGEMEWEILQTEWDLEKVKNWGVDIPKDWFKPEEPLDDKAENTKRSIQISFENDDYVEAYRLIQFFRDNSIYLGKHAIKWLTELKENEHKNLN